MDGIISQNAAMGEGIGDTPLLLTPSPLVGQLVGMFTTLCWRCGMFLSASLTLAVGALYWKQDSLLYFPTVQGIPRRPSENPRRYRSPAEHNAPHETISIPCEDGVRLHSWLLFHPDAKQKRIPTVLFFHGNAGNIGLRIPNALSMFHNLKVNVWLVEYRGYGDSDDATPSEEGLKLDAEAALRFAHDETGAHARHVDRTRIFAFGRSLGGAVTFHLAQYSRTVGIKYPLAGILVENTFTSISNMVDHVMPFVAPIKGLVLRIGWDSASAVPKLGDMPVMLLAGAKDTLVPHSHMQELFRLCKRTYSKAADDDDDGDLVKMHVVEDGTHNETWAKGGKEYWRAIQNFFGAVFEAEERSQRWGKGRRLGGTANADAGGCRDVDHSLNVTPPLDEGAIGAVGTAPSIPTVGNFMDMAREATVAGAGLIRSGSRQTDPYKKTE